MRIEEKSKARGVLYLALLFMVFLGCTTIPKQSVELSEITGNQIAELHKSHVRFVELYYDKLKEDVNTFMDEKWTPTFLSKVVKNQEFRKDLDEAYVTSGIEAEDLLINWKGRPIPEPQNSAVLSGVKDAVADQRARLGAVLLDFAESAQEEITKKRRELLAPVNSQERMVLNEINGAFADLQQSHSAIKGLLASAVELKEQQNVVMQKLGILESTQKLMDAAVNSSEKLSAILKVKENAENTAGKFLDQIKESQKELKQVVTK